MIGFLLTVSSLLHQSTLHETIGDHQSAFALTEQALMQDPESKEAAAAYVRALAQTGAVAKAASAYKGFTDRFVDTDRAVLESVAWGVLKAGLHASSEQTRLTALIGAARTRDGRVVEAVVRMLRSSHALERYCALELSPTLRDQPIKTEVKRLFDQEQVRGVRLAATSAIGALQMVEMRPALEAQIASDQTPAEEKVAAIQAVVDLVDTLQRSEVEALAAHPRAGLRHLAFRAIGLLEIRECRDLVFEGLKDPIPQVRDAALEALGMIRVAGEGEDEILECVLPMLDDPAPMVAIRAAWFVAQFDPERGCAALAHWLHHPRMDLARKAAGAIACCGRYTAALACNHVCTHPDPFVRANLACGLLDQRIEIQKASTALLEVITTDSTQWMWDEQGGALRTLVPSRERHDTLIPNRPQLIDQLTRLEVLGYVAAVQPDRVTDVLRSFLTHVQWGVSGTAAISLLQEGDDTALDAVRALLSDSDRTLRVQAALALAIWGRDPDAMSVLIAAYPEASRTLKAHILEAVGHIGSQEALPFLAARLREHSLTLRVVAASAIIQCLNA